MYITTDRGTQFESQLFAQLSQTLGFCRLRTTSYPPQSNGKLERFHRTLKAALMSSKTDWIAALPVVLFGLRSKPDSNFISPLAATTGLDVLYPKTVAEKTAPITLAFIKNLQDNLEQLAFTKDIRQHPTRKTFIPGALDNCKFVWLRVDRVKQPLEAPYTGPHELIKINRESSTATVTKKTTISSSAFSASNFAQYHLIVKRLNTITWSHPQYPPKFIAIANNRITGK